MYGNVLDLNLYNWCVIADYGAILPIHSRLSETPINIALKCFLAISTAIAIELKLQRSIVIIAKFIVVFHTVVRWSSFDVGKKLNLKVMILYCFDYVIIPLNLITTNDLFLSYKLHSAMKRIIREIPITQDTPIHTATKIIVLMLHFNYISQYIVALICSISIIRRISVYSIADDRRQLFLFNRKNSGIA